MFHYFIPSEGGNGTDRDVEQMNLTRNNLDFAFNRIVGKYVVSEYDLDQGNNKSDAAPDAIEFSKKISIFFAKIDATLENKFKELMNVLEIGATLENEFTVLMNELEKHIVLSNEITHASEALTEAKKTAKPKSKFHPKFTSPKPNLSPTQKSLEKQLKQLKLLETRMFNYMSEMVNMLEVSGAKLFQFGDDVVTLSSIESVNSFFTDICKQFKTFDPPKKYSAIQETAKKRIAIAARKLIKAKKFIAKLKKK